MVVLLLRRCAPGKEGNTMRIEEQAIRKYLSGPLGAELAVYEEIDSTNNAAKLLAKNGAPHGAAVIARRQSAGKGRLGRAFFSPPDAGVYLSVILRPALAPEQTLTLTAAAAVAVYRAVKAVCGLETKIKWVNDVYLNGRKLCGILAEAALCPGGVDYIVLGIGVNVKKSAFPPELADAAISLEEAGAGAVDPSRLAAEILNSLGRCLEGGFLEEYRARSCVLGRRVRVLRGNETFYADAKSLDDRAQLHVVTEAGEEIVLCSGEVSLRGDFS